MKHYNLVYCKHHSDDRRAYLYELPLDKEAHPGVRLCVEDRRGEHVVTAFCENWLASDKMTKVLCEANGGYYPPAKVVGKIKTVTVQQDVVEKFPVVEEQKEEEDEWWF